MTPMLVRALLILPAAVLGAALPAQALQLEGGRILLAKVEDAHTDGLTVRRLDNGGILELRWDHLTPDCAERVKSSHGLVVEDDGEVMVRATVLTFDSDGVLYERIGRIVDRTQREIVHERLGLRQRFSREDIVGIEEVEVPVGEVFTSEQYYAQLLAEHAPGDDPDKHAVLGEQLMRARDYDRAEEHLRRALELGEEAGEWQNARKVPQLLSRLEVYKEAAAERELLDQIRIRRVRGAESDFAKGMELIATFEERFPDSKLKAEFAVEKRRFEQARRRFLTGRVVDLWKRMTKTIADRKVLEDDLGLAEARQYAEGPMGEDVAERVAGVLDLGVEEVASLFADRHDAGIRIQKDTFAYGIGSWVLGRDAIMAETRKGEEGEQPALQPGTDRKVKRLAKRLEEARRRALRAFQSGAQNAKTTDEDWWEGAESSSRALWLRAYYAEFGGDFELVAAYVSPCHLCAGKGNRETLSSNGQRVEVECPLCHGTRFTRRVQVH